MAGILLVLRFDRLAFDLRDLAPAAPRRPTTGAPRDFMSPWKCDLSVVPGALL